MAAIKAAQVFAPRWENAFAGAQSLYLSTSDFVSSREFTYDLTLADFPVFAMSSVLHSDVMASIFKPRPFA